MEPRERIVPAAVGGLVGFAIGGLLFRWDAFWDWIQAADWSPVPATIVGTAVPAAAGVLFAQAYAKRSVRSLRETEIEVAERYEARKAQEVAQLRDARRLAWESLYDLLDEFTEAREPFAKEVHDRARREWEEGGKPKDGLDIVDFANDLASSFVEAGRLLSTFIPGLLAAADRLVETHNVEAMVAPREAMRLMSDWANDPGNWMPEDYEWLITFATAHRKSDRARAGIGLASATGGAFQHLRTISRRQRALPHESEDVEMWVSVPTFQSGGPSSRNVDVAQEFADLADRLRDYLAGAGRGFID